VPQIALPLVEALQYVTTEQRITTKYSLLIAIVNEYTFKCLSALSPLEQLRNNGSVSNKVFNQQSLNFDKRTFEHKTKKKILLS
jgi:hypothetical protein